MRNDWWLNSQHPTTITECSITQGFTAIRRRGLGTQDCSFGLVRSCQF